MTVSSNSKNSVRWFYAAVVLYCVVFMLGYFTVRDYGMTWDEPFRFSGGDAKLNYYQSLFSGETVEPLKDSYPGLFDLPLAIVHEQFPDWGTRSQKGHVWSLCFGLLGLLSVWRLTARIGGERAGFWALLLLATLPRYYGHMFFNPKDIPLAATYTIGLWALVELFSRLPRPDWKPVICIGLAAGMAMSCRIAGFLILCYLGLFVALFLLLRLLSKDLTLPQLPKEIGYWVVRGGVAGLLGFTILAIFWPTLHQNPFASVGASMETVQSYGWGGFVLMDGNFWEAQDLPFYYVPYWLLFTLPEHIMLFLAIGLGGGAFRSCGLARVRAWARLLPLMTPGVVVFAAAFPLLYIVSKDPVLYDGMRHILFTLPPLVATSALAFEWCLRGVTSRCSSRAALILQMGLGVAVLITVAEMILLHPYQYVYFNQVSGGLPAAYARDETDYWGLSHKEAGDWLNEYVEQIAPAGERVFKVHQRYTRSMLKEALDPNRFEMWQPREGADFFVSITRFNLHSSYPEAKLLHVVERQGVPLCFIYSFNSKASK